MAAPDQHILGILTTASTTIAVAQEKTLENRCWIPYDGFHTVIYTMDTLSSITRDAHGVQPNVRRMKRPVDEDALAYVIFTSGSTGTPKGVEITHRGAVNTCLDIVDRFGVGPTDAVFAISSLAFDLSVFDIFGTLSVGATIVMCKPNGTKDPDYWWQQIHSHGITVWNSVPMMFEMLVECMPSLATMPLKTVMLSGDAIRTDFADRVIRSYPEMRLIALGGATEASIWSNWHEVSADSISMGTALVPYGVGLSNQALYILDGHLENRPVGAVGEIFIGGLGESCGFSA